MQRTPSNRRKFIANSFKTAALLSAPNILLTACGGGKKATAIPKKILVLEQAPLPYAYNAFEQVIDAKTMDLHYTKHAAGYVSNANKAMAAENIVAKNIETILANISKYSMTVRNNAGGHFNHEMYWQCLTPNEALRKIPEALLQKINESFGTVEKFTVEFTNAAKAIFGSGWAWLCVEEKTGKLFISTTPNQDNPLMDVASKKGWPILGIDVWEHAYYLKYQNKRIDYLNNIWQIINWNYVEQRRLSAYQWP
jgi:superoxide dismutase, Fe-Mn family